MAQKNRGDTPKNRAADFERAAERLETGTYVLRLFVTGSTPKSMRAIANIREVCEEHLKGRYELEVIDLYQHPQLARGEQIVAVPTLVKKLPLPIRKLVGELTDREKVLFGLDITEKQ